MLKGIVAWHGSDALSTLLKPVVVTVTALEFRFYFNFNVILGLHLFRVNLIFFYVCFFICPG